MQLHLAWMFALSLVLDVRRCSAKFQFVYGRVDRYSLYMTAIQEAPHCFRSDRINKQFCLTEVLKSSYQNHVGL